MRPPEADPLPVRMDVPYLYAQAYPIKGNTLQQNHKSNYNKI